MLAYGVLEQSKPHAKESFNLASSTWLHIDIACDCLPVRLQSSFLVMYIHFLMDGMAIATRCGSDSVKID
jgi:hypothetical protein